MRLGIPELLILGPLILGPLLLVLLAGIFVPRLLGKRAKRFGYESTGAYLKSAPRSDPEKRDAADLALKGLVFCILGLIFSPFVLVGLIPLFYGGRKLVYASMGLGLVDDAELPRA